jgi:uncharacterized repeat protein (TIGR03803 family)
MLLSTPGSPHRLPAIPILAPVAALSLLLFAATPAAAQPYQFNTLATFTGSNGSAPNDLVALGNGNYIGTTYQGGNYSPISAGGGTIFSYSAASGIQTLATFNGPNGMYPQGNLVEDVNGNFYGTTTYGGSTWNQPIPGNPLGDGSFFGYSASGGLQMLASFTSTGPVSSGQLMANGGAVIGTNFGSIYQYSASGGYQTLVTPGTSIAGLISDGSGGFYGAYAGGYPANQDGAIFHYTTSGGLQSLASFNYTDGYSPTSFITDGKGNYYGTTEEGGPGSSLSSPPYGNGTIFKWSASGGLQMLFSFNGTNGSDPTSLAIDKNGNLYGTTLWGGIGYDGSPDSGAGTIFEYSASGGLQTLVNFNGMNVDHPNNLMSDGAGNWIGLAAGDQGAVSGHDIIFGLASQTPEAPTDVLIALGGALVFARSLRFRRRARG